MAAGIGSQTNQTTESIKQAAEAANQAISVFQDLTKAVDSIGNGLKTGRSGFDDMTSATLSLSKAAASSSEVFGSLLGSIPGFKGIGDGISGILGAAATASEELTKVVSSGVKTAIEFGDSFSKAVRTSDAEMFGLTKQFGLGIEAAEGLTNAIASQSMTEFSKSMILATGDLREFLTSAKVSNLSMDTLTENVSTAYGNLDLFTIATGQAAAAGITAGESVRYLETAITKQGMSAQTAIETMAGFSEIAKETGLNFSTVANTLNQAVSQFNKLGMSADFGRPILENFAKTVKEVGLGIDVATDATQSLVSAMGGLSDNYGLAYLTQIRGGGGATAGGVLGTSIEMRQNMREAEATGDQGAMAIEMAKQMRDTISSMTGGNIITLDQAAGSPELQSQFYMQGQMLSQYGIRDTGTQDVVLDLLSKIDEAGAMGDTQGQKELADQLSREIEGRDKTTDQMDKLNTTIGSLEAVYVTNTRALGEFTRELIARPVATGAGLAAGGVLSNLESDMMDIIDNYGLSKEKAQEMNSEVYKYIVDNAKKVTKVDLSEPTPVSYDKEGRPEYGSMFDSFKSALKEIMVGSQVVKIELSDEARALVNASSGPSGVNNSGTGTSPGGQ